MRSPASARSSAGCRCRSRPRSRLTVRVSSCAVSSSQPDSRRSAAMVSSSGSQSRSVSGMRGAVDAMTRASLRSVFEPPGSSWAALRIAPPGRYAVRAPMSLATVSGSGPIVLGWSTITRTVPLRCSLAMVLRSCFSSWSTGVSRMVLPSWSRAHAWCELLPTSRPSQTPMSAGCMLVSRLSVRSGRRVPVGGRS